MRILGQKLDCTTGVISCSHATLHSNKERDSFYDWVRFIATILVVIGHSAYLRMSTTYGGVAYNLPENLSYAYNSGFLSWCRFLAGWVYGFHMALFFSLSGGVLALRPLETFTNILRKKILRLLVPYFVYGWLFMLPVKRIGNFYDNNSLRMAYRGFLLGLDSGHLWFLTALFWCIIVFVIVTKLTRKIPYKYINSSYSLLFLSGVVQYTCKYIPFDFLSLKLGLSYIFYFSLGYVFEVEIRSKLQNRLHMKQVFFLGLILLLMEIINYRYVVLNKFFTTMNGCFFIYVLADLCNRHRVEVFNTKPWKVVVKNLFYVYLFHDPLNYIILRVFMSHQYLSTAIGCYAFTLSRTVILFFISMFLGELIECVTNRLKIVFEKIMQNC